MLALGVELADAESVLSDLRKSSKASREKRVSALTDEVCAYFDKRCRRAGIQRRSRPAGHRSRIANLLKLDASLSPLDFRIVVAWAVERWPHHDIMQNYVRLSTILKHQGPGRTFFDYLEDAEIWADSTYGHGWREQRQLKCIDGGKQ